MTRWARSGNSQKHKKPPEDPTPWKEFFVQKKLKFHSKNSSLQTEVTKPNQSLLSANKICEDSESTHVLKKEKNMKSSIKNSKRFLRNIKLKANKLKLTNICSVPQSVDAEKCHSNEENIKSQNDVNSCLLKDKKLKKQKKKGKMFNIPKIEIVHTVDSFSDTEKMGNEVSEHKTNEFVQNKKLKKEGRSDSDSVHKKVKNLEKLDEEKNSLISPKSSTKLPKQEKKKYLDRLKEKRAKKGILLLPPKTEKKLYNMKKGLRKKGVSGDEIKEIIRKVRRKEELQFRKTLKTCYKCRKVGHVMSECPLINTDNEEGTGICFKCGSTEHSSYKCSLKTTDFPFAKCFICKKQGHLSRVCPNNKHGVYPKGGKCNLCGSINHLKKDCPLFKKNEKEEEEVTVGMISSTTSVDEIDDAESFRSISKKIKAVKF